MMAKLLRAAIFIALVFGAKNAFAGTCPPGNQTIDPLGNPITIANVGVTGITTGSIATCFYVSKSTGTDTNNGTSETTPWAHMPGMPDCTSTCASTSPSPGTGIILRGGDNWVSSDLPITWLWNGTGSHPIYVGVDKTWYNSGTCGALWCRPIFSASGTSGDVFSLVNRSWVIFDNIEVTGMTNAQNGCRMSGGSNVRCTQLYFHGWSHTASSNNVGFFSQCGTGSMVDHNVVDGSDSSKNTMNGVFISCAGTIQYNYFNYVVSGVLGSVDNFNHNIILHSVTSADGDHCNGMFVFGPQTGLTLDVYNNIVGSMICSGGVNFWLNGNASPGSSLWVSTAYNNLILASAASGNVFNIGGHPSQGNSGAYNVYNNTIVALNGGACLGNGEPSPRSTTNFANNHCIGGSIICDGAGTTCVNGGGNLLQSVSTANSQGYTSTELQEYSPINACTASTCSTLSAGINVTSLCTGNLTALCTSTSYPTYNATNHTMGVGNASPAGITRGTSWDTGAYQFSGGTVGGAVSLVQQVGIGHGVQTGTYPFPPTGTFASSQAAGDTNVIVIEYCGLPGGSGGGANCLSGSNATGPITSITDTAKNTYTRNCGPITTISSGSYTNACGGGSPTIDGFTTWVEVWSAPNINSSAAGNVVTGTMTNVNNMTGWNVWMFQLHTTSGHVIFDQFISKQSGTQSAPVAGPISTGTTPTTNYANEFFFAFCNTSNGTCLPPLNTPTWTEAGLGTTNGQFYDTHSDGAYRIVTSTQTASESFTAGSGVNEWLGMLVTYGSSSSQAQAPQPPTGLQATVQ